MLKAIIFDLDGVICHTDEYHYQAWKEMADKYGIYFDRIINDRLRGIGRLESLEIILERAERNFTKRQKEEMAEEKNAIYQRLLSKMTKEDLSDEVKMTLQELRNQGYLMAIGSSSKNTKFILERLGLSDFFGAISDGTNITKSKPDPEVFLKAAEMFKVIPADALVVEDAISGVDAAISGGFQAAGIGEAARDSRVNFPLNHFKELLLHL